MIEDPIDHLLDEHAEIMEQVRGLRVALRELDLFGESAVQGVLPELRVVGQMMATTLLRHARKEDEALFPAVEAILGEGGSPTGPMREEHQQIHAEAARFRDTLRELHQVEHPAIVAGGDRLRELAVHGGTAQELSRTGSLIVSLLDAHFRKEEEVLFPMARTLLDDPSRTWVARTMEAIESE